MTIDEREVYVTPDGLGRAAIARRSDGLYCIFVHWIWSDGAKRDFKVVDGGRSTWNDDETSVEYLYHDINPETGVYGTIADAVNAIASISGFADAKKISLRRR